MTLVLSFGCARPEPLIASPRSMEEHAGLKEETRDLAKPECGSCHQSSLETAKPGAIAVFDLDAEDWASRMNADRLYEFLVRIDGDLDESTRPRVRAFLESELARRGTFAGR
jgi:hypothetical protein